MTLLRRHLLSLAAVFACAECLCPAFATVAQDQSASPVAPVPEIFAPGMISGPASDGSPTFSPDGNTIFFTRSAANWTVIVESHRAGTSWSEPTIASFSGEWPDSSPAMAPDGSYLIFQSNRPVKFEPDSASARAVSNLWRVNRIGTGWSKPLRLPDQINLPGQSIFKPSIAADGTVYLTAIDKKGNKQLFSARVESGVYENARPLSFSDGTKADVDPEIAPDGSFLLFCSSGRLAGDTRDHLYIVLRAGANWGAVTQLRYGGDDTGAGSGGDQEPHLGVDHRTLYFSSDRSIPVHFPRTREQAEQDLQRLNSWDNSNNNVWFFSIGPWLVRNS